MATLTAFTVSTILQLISDLRGESSTNTDTIRIRAVSHAEQDLAKRRFFRVHQVRDQSIGTGNGSTQDFTIGSATYPMRDKGLFEVFVGGTEESNRYQVVDYTQYKELVNSDASSRVAYEYYDQANDAWKVKVNPVPSNGDGVTASWYFIPPTRTLTTESVVTPDIYIVAYLALADLYHGEDELQLEQLARQEAENRLGEAEGRELTPAVNQIYQMRSSVKKGIGTY